MSAIAASVATLVFESPFIQLEKIVFGRKSPMEKHEKSLAKDDEPLIQDATILESDNKSEENNEGETDSLSDASGQIQKTSTSIDGDFY